MPVSAGEKLFNTINDRLKLKQLDSFDRLDNQDSQASDIIEEKYKDL